MAVRSTMTDLIAAVRDLINDTQPAGSGQVWTDQQVQDRLDRWRTDVWNAPLAPQITMTQGGIYDYTDYYANVGNWEADEKLQWVDWRALTPASADRIKGRWTFSVAAPGQLPTVFITGKYYDLYGCAADLLEMWAAKYALAYGFAAPAGGGTFNRQQMFQQLTALAQLYRQQQMPRELAMTRGDFNADGTSLLLGALDVKES